MPKVVYNPYGYKRHYNIINSTPNCDALMYKIKYIMNLNQSKILPEERLEILSILKEIERYQQRVPYEHRNMMHRILNKIQENYDSR